jgi:hypothetical protein
MTLERLLFGKIEKQEIIKDQLKEGNTVMIHSGEFEQLFHFHQKFFQELQISKANFFTLEIKNLIGEKSNLDFNKSEPNFRSSALHQTEGKQKATFATK